MCIRDRREAYIGVSGMMLAPKVYLGIGISGQMQHMVGVNRAGTMFAVNKDKNAPILDVYKRQARRRGHHHVEPA